MQHVSSIKRHVSSIKLKAFCRLQLSFVTSSQVKATFRDEIRPNLPMKFIDIFSSDVCSANLLVFTFAYYRCRRTELRIVFFEYTA